MDHIVGCEVPEATGEQERLVTPYIRRMPKTGGPWTSSSGRHCQAAQAVALEAAPFGHTAPRFSEKEAFERLEETNSC
jgi:hypothetical protein